MLNETINTNSQKDVRQWKIICLILLAIIFFALIILIFWEIHEAGYTKGYQQGMPQGFLLAIQDICQDGAITIQNNMTTKIIPLQEVCGR